MADAEHERLVRLGDRFGVEVRRVVPELRLQLARADCVVGMAGYNTVCDVLSYRRPAVLVPRPGPSQEQLMRADRLRAWQAVDVVHPAELSGPAIASAIQSALSRGEPPAPPVSLDGLSRALDVLDAALEQSRAA